MSTCSKYLEKGKKWVFRFNNFKIMSAAPKEIELNIPAAVPKPVEGTQVNLRNWRNWLAAVIAVALIVVAARYSFMNLGERRKMEKFIKNLS